MPYKLRKAPKRDAYWVVTKDTGKKHSIEPLPLEKAKAQMRALYASMNGSGYESDSSSSSSDSSYRGGGDSDDELAAIFSNVDLVEEPIERPPPPPPKTPPPRPKPAAPPAVQRKGVKRKAEQIGKGITIPRKKFLAEHKHLIDILLTGSPKQRKAEASKQSKELKGSGYILKKIDDYYYVQDTELNKLIKRFKTAKEAIEEINRLNRKPRVIVPRLEKDEGSDDELKELFGKGKPLGEVLINILKKNKSTMIPDLIEAYNAGSSEEQSDMDDLFMSHFAWNEFPDAVQNELPGKRLSFINLIQRDAGTRPSSPTGSGPIPERSILNQIAKQAYESNPAHTVGDLELISHTPTLKFYYDQDDNTIVVSIRGTKDFTDLSADATIAFNKLQSSSRFKNDLAKLKEFQKSFPPSQYDYYGVGHSLGGAILDQFLKMGLLKNGVSFNPAVQPADVKSSNERVYKEGDPLLSLGQTFLGLKPEVTKEKKSMTQKIIDKIPFSKSIFDLYKSHTL